MSLDRTIYTSKADTSPVVYGDACMEEAMSALREVAIDDVEVSAGFDASVLRRHKLLQSRRTIKFWMPALVCAVVTALAVVTFLQLVAVPVSSAAHADPIEFAPGQ